MRLAQTVLADDDVEAPAKRNLASGKAVKFFTSSDSSTVSSSQAESAGYGGLLFPPL